MKVIGGVGSTINLTMKVCSYDWTIEYNGILKSGLSLVSMTQIVKHEVATMATFLLKIIIQT